MKRRSRQQDADFDSRTYGYPTLTKLIEAMELFEIDKRQLGSNKKIHDIYVRDPRR
ncbi:OST-HTH/LOTUS domain-containing protein [Marinobacterium aestuariivivens]|uniref:OST-HTH/LOTUS domain-containing protein n=1 Tax=Marinobacterium aestuariivivens TaxID=1698799 RepID=A0ABW2A2M4_9GAMM